ncbi:MAG: hypothetical protein ABI652_09170 [Acidobacteriota bacterium]
MPRRTAVPGVIGACAGVALAAAVLHAREAQRMPRTEGERVLYLRSPETVRRTFRPFTALAADVYWMRAIQHYGRDRQSSRVVDRFALLQPLLDLTTTLDPHFNIAYRFGAIFLSTEPPDGPGANADAIALLEKGLRANPRRWQYGQDIGFIYYWYLADYPKAARWFERASEMPGAPVWLQPLAATTRAQGGDRQGARHLFAGLRGADQAYISQAATRALSQLDALDAMDALQDIVARFHAATGRYPHDWDELIRTGALRGVPAESDSKTPFAYDPVSHRVTLSPTSPLMPLPPGFAPK